MAGYSHRSDAADQMIKERHAAPGTIIPMLETFLSRGVDTIMAPFGMAQPVFDAVKQTEQKTGREILNRGHGFDFDLHQKSHAVINLDIGLDVVLRETMQR